MQLKTSVKLLLFDLFKGRRTYHFMSNFKSTLKLSKEEISIFSPITPVCTINFSATVIPSKLAARNSCLSENIQFTIKYKKVHPTYVQQITFNNEKKFGYDYNGTPCCDVYANAYKKQWNTFIDAIRNINVEANRERLFGYSKTFDSVETVAKLLSVECL